MPPPNPHNPPILSCCRAPLTADKAPGNAAGAGARALLPVQTSGFTRCQGDERRGGPRKERGGRTGRRALTRFFVKGALFWRLCCKQQRLVAKLTSRRSLSEQMTTGKDRKCCFISTNAPVRDPPNLCVHACAPLALLTPRVPSDVETKEAGGKSRGC